MRNDAFDRWRPAYAVAYWASYAWFLGFCAFAATRPENQAAGLPTLLGIFAVGFAPCAILWTVRRVMTGKWLG